MSEISERIGAFWSGKSKEQTKGAIELRWWQSQKIIEHINFLVCGEKISGASQGLIEVVKRDFSFCVPFEKGISVGCGAGQKEINLVKQGIVESFFLYELSDERIKIGRDLVEQHGLAEKVHFVHGDAFEMLERKESFDLVHWNNSLHHMMNVSEAVEWSKDILKKGGLFYMDDFIGATRFQWSDRQLEMATMVREIFRDSKYLIDPRDKTKVLSSQIRRPNAEALEKDDPSEAADSSNILTAVKTFFPNAFLQETGGVIYHLVLNDMLANFGENNNDKLFLDLLLLIDSLCCELGETQYGVGLALKEQSN